MALWDTIKQIATQDAEHFIGESIRKNNVDVDFNDTPIRAYEGYFRIWISDMFLTKSRNWFKNWHAAVHASVQLQFGDQAARTFTRAAQAPEEALGQGVLKEYKVLDLMPFNGGTVELQASLLALQGDDYLGKAIGVLQDFSELVGAPLAQAVAISEKVANGIDKLVGATNGSPHLVFHDTFTAAGTGRNELRAGYWAIVKATKAQIATDRLAVKEGKLCYAKNPGAASVPLQGYDYILLRIETQAERDDWRLKGIEEALAKAYNAYYEGEQDKYEAYKRMAELVVWQSADLSKHDRRRVIQAIRRDLEEVTGGGLGAAGEEARDLNAMMATWAMPVMESRALGEPTFEELFGQ
jgi:hypothetical protein